MTIRVLIAHNRYRESGGEERHVALLDRSLRGAGLQTMLFEPSSDALERSLRRRLLVGVTLAYNPSAAGLPQVLAAWKPDIVHFHNLWPLLTPAALRLAKRSGGMVVMTLHNCRFACPAGTCPTRHHPPENGLYENRCIAGSSLRCAVVNRPRDSVAESALYGVAQGIQRRLHLLSRWVDAFIVPSVYVQRMAERSGIRPDRIHLIPHGVPRTEAQRTADPQYALYVGRLSPEKGVRTLLRAARLAPDVPLAVAGSGPLEDEVRAANALYLGQLSQERLGCARSRSAFGVVPSECHESFPYAALEAFSSGRPVIASRVGGIPEVVLHGRTGLLVPAGSADALAGAMRQLWHDRRLAVDLGDAARRLVCDAYTLDLQVERTVSLYDTLLHGRATKEMSRVSRGLGRRTSAQGLRESAGER